MAAPKSSPLTFELTEEMQARLEACRRGHGYASASAVVRAALAAFDFAGCRPVRAKQRQLSVRVSADQRALLRRHARLKRVSVGELLRLALAAMPVKPGRR
jgi:Arc/MetJ-type ribon-helix-helix transcriptional regulator